MIFGERKILLWPLIAAAAFFLIPVGLFLAHPFGFWSSGSDNEPLGLANALNLAYRLADLRMYPAIGLTNHPGIQFYLMSWLALAFSGHPIPLAGQELFFRDVIDHVEDYHRASVGIAALVGAAGVYIFARTALKLVPVGVTAAGLLLWLVSTPATILYFMSPGFESVAILVNSLFLLILVRLAFDRELSRAVIVVAGCIGAFAYLDKLSYIYVPLALFCVIFWKAVFGRVGWLRGVAMVGLCVFAFIATSVLVGYFVIGWSSFTSLLRFHRSVVVGSELYGEGDRIVVDGNRVWLAIRSIPGHQTYAVPLALVAGQAFFIAGLVTGFRNRQNHGVALIGIGAGLAAAFSALSVLKHYDPHYTAGVSATLPACAVAFWLFAQTWNRRLRFRAAAIACIAVLLMAGPVLSRVITVLEEKHDYTLSAWTDKKEIEARIAGITKVVDFAYRVPFSQYGEGFIVYYAGVPRLVQEHLQGRRGVTNSLTERVVTEDVGAYVIDKSYFRDVQAVKTAPNLDLLGPKPVRFNEGDELIEFRTVFLLIRK
jgi:hypothetical protein